MSSNDDTNYKMMNETPKKLEDSWLEATQQMIQEISEEIYRMLDYSESDNEDADFENLKMHTAYGKGRIRDDTSLTDFLSVDGEEIKNLEGSNEKKTPTKLSPYDVWKKSQESPLQQKKKQVPKFSPKEWSEMGDRLNSYAEKKQNASKIAQNNAVKAELAECAFKPVINQKSKDMTNLLPLSERSQLILSKKEEKLAKERKRLEELELAELMPPKLNKSKMWSPRVERKYETSVSERMSKEDVELTFTPKINSRSNKLADRAKANGTRRSLVATAETSPAAIGDTVDDSISQQCDISNINDDSVTTTSKVADRKKHKTSHASIPVNTIVYRESEHLFLLQILAKAQQEKSELHGMESQTHAPS